MLVRSGILLLVVVVLGCGPSWITSVPKSQKALDTTPEPSGIADVALANFLKPAPRVFSGGEPTSAEDFAQLKRLGVQTVVSVDGIRPNLVLARDHDLEYVHIPIGYDGIDEHAQRSIVRLVQDRTGPFYIHCHHGKHRGPAVAAVACRATGDFDAQEALQFLELAGTDPLYAGLFRDVAAFKMPAKGIVLPELVSHARVADLAEQMSRIDRIFDGMADAKSIQREDTVLLVEAFREAVRTTSTSDPELYAAMQDVTHHYASLHESTEKLTAEKILQSVRQKCDTCHRQFRDKR